MSRDQDIQLERDRARYGLLAVLTSNLSIAAVAVIGVWRLNGDKSVIIGVLTAAFTAVSSMTTAYLGIKAVSNTAKSLASSAAARTPAAAPNASASAAPAAPNASASAPPAAPAAATATPAPATPAAPTAAPATQRGQ